MEYRRMFFSEKRAKSFINELMGNGVGKIVLSAAKDGFGQTQYTVIWSDEEVEE